MISNAVQAMPEGGTMTVETACLERYVSLVVTDTGTGMPEDVKEKVFEPFFTTKDAGEGTGLGLPVVHSIVTAHGGQVEVQSQPGCGTRFAVHLPLDEPAGTRYDT